MTRGQYRMLHKWIFIFMGAFILMWCISGILMMLPQDWFGEANTYSRPAIDFRKVTLSPAAAIERVATQSGGTLQATQAELTQIHDTPVYRVSGADGESRVIDAVTGEPFVFTAALAEAIPRSVFSITAPMTEQTRLTEHDGAYRFGQLPAYRLRFEDAPEADFYVVESDGRVIRMTAIARVRNFIMTLHALDPVGRLTHSDNLRKLMLVSTALVTILGAIVGYILTLPGGAKGRRPAR